MLGVDDFAVHRNHRYGTLVVDLERHQLLDLWPERTAQPLIAWLREQAGPPDVICRDRAGTYADAARQGAPEARQVADRFHLACNAGAVLERVLVRHAVLVRTATTRESARSDHAEPHARGTSSAGDVLAVRRPHATAQASTTVTREARRARRLARYDQAVELYRAGASLTAIAQQMGLARSTVRKYVHADGFPEWPPRRTPLHAGAVHMTYLRERWAAGCRDATILWAELRERGFTGSCAWCNVLWLGGVQPRAFAAPVTPVKTGLARMRCPATMLDRHLHRCPHRLAACLRNRRSGCCCILRRS